MIHAIAIALSFVLVAAAAAGEYKHVGDFLLQSHFKLTGDKITPIPMKPIAFRVDTDGVHVRVTAEGDDDAHTTFEIYRADGISRQHSGRGSLEVIPGLQATSHSGGELRHLRLSRESLTMTTFPSVSDQTIISYAIAAKAIPAKNKPAIATPADGMPTDGKPVKANPAIAPILKSPPPKP